MTLSPDSVFKKKPEIVSRKIADEVLLVPVYGELSSMQKIFSLNDVSEYIWEELDGKKRLGELIRQITDTFEVDEATAENDLYAFIQSLTKAGLIDEVRDGM